MTSRNLLCSLVAVALTLAVTAAPARAQDNTQATFGNLIAALNNLNVQIDNLEVLEEGINVGDITVGDVTVVDASNLLAGARIRALNNALNNNNVDVDALQNFLNESIILTDFLNDLNINLEEVEVIAIDILDGDLVVFTLPL